MGNINDVVKTINTNSVPLQELVNSIVAESCGGLDDYMQSIDNMLIKDSDIPTETIENMMLNINSMLYWIGNGLEQVTIRESMAKMVHDEVYNKAYNSAEGTIGDKKASAILEAQQEDIIKTCFTAALKLYQFKIDRAAEMSSALKKILTRRISELELSRGVT